MKYQKRELRPVSIKAGNFIKIGGNLCQVKLVTSEDSDQYTIYFWVLRGPTGGRNSGIEGSLTIWANTALQVYSGIA